MVLPYTCIITPVIMPLWLGVTSIGSGLSQQSALSPLSAVLLLLLFSEQLFRYLCNVFVSAHHPHWWSRCCFGIVSVVAYNQDLRRQQQMTLQAHVDLRYLKFRLDSSYVWHVLRLCEQTPGSEPVAFCVNQPVDIASCSESNRKTPDQVMRSGPLGKVSSSLKIWMSIFICDMLH